MLDKFFAKPMELKIGEQTISFLSIADFEFCMHGRTSVPSSKITDLVKCSTKQLQKEAHTIKDIEKRFVAILSRSIENPPQHQPLAQRTGYVHFLTGSWMEKYHWCTK